MKIFLITPNYNEAAMLVPSATPKEAAKILSSYCNVLLKGGHNAEEIGVDYLYKPDGGVTPLSFAYSPVRLVGSEGSGVRTLKPFTSVISAKHGSGCVMSSAITANLALGHDLHTSCINAKRYIERFLSSNNSLLGYHHV